MKTLIQRIILFFYGWKVHRTVYRTMDNYGNITTGYYPMLYKKGYFTGYGYRYHPIDLAWSKQFNTNPRISNKRVIIATILGDFTTFVLGTWFVIWIVYNCLK